MTIDLISPTDSGQRTDTGRPTADSGSVSLLVGLVITARTIFGVLLDLPCHAAPWAMTLWYFQAMGWSMEAELQEILDDSFNSYDSMAIHTYIEVKQKRGTTQRPFFKVDLVA